MAAWIRKANEAESGTAIHSPAESATQRYHIIQHLHFPLSLLGSYLNFSEVNTIVKNDMKICPKN